MSTLQGNLVYGVSSIDVREVMSRRVKSCDGVVDWLIVILVDLSTLNISQDSCLTGELVSAPLAFYVLRSLSILRYTVNSRPALSTCAYMAYAGMLID